MREGWTAVNAATCGYLPLPETRKMKRTPVGGAVNTPSTLHGAEAVRRAETFPFEAHASLAISFGLLLDWREREQRAQGKSREQGGRSADEEQLYDGVS